LHKNFHEHVENFGQRSAVKEEGRPLLGGLNLLNEDRLSRNFFE
jgi:hypothetical protein